MPYNSLRHSLRVHSDGLRRELISHHFGAKANGRKVYIQAALHADEIPGMLVAQALHPRLLALDAAGKIAGEIVLVPSANPIGLSQFIQGAPFGRFDLATGMNFNRGFLNLIPQLKTALEGKLGRDAQANTKLARQTIATLLAHASAKALTETVALKLHLQTLAHDADIVLDLHCDNEAAMHLYTGTHVADAALPLAQFLGAQAVLIAHESGDDPFDETCGRLWKELADHFGSAHPFSAPCLSVTVELRGEMDVSHELAQTDANALLGFLAHAGHIDIPVPELPPARCAATPLQGVERLDAPHAGVLVFRQAVGTRVAVGDPIVDIVNPQSGAITTLTASAEGILFARIAHRYAHAGLNLAKIAGAVAFRTGKLLSL